MLNSSGPSIACEQQNASTVRRLGQVFKVWILREFQSLYPAKFNERFYASPAAFQKDDFVVKLIFSCDIALILVLSGSRGREDKGFSDNSIETIPMILGLSSSCFHC